MVQRGVCIKNWESEQDCFVLKLRSQPSLLLLFICCYTYQIRAKTIGAVKGDNSSIAPCKSFFVHSFGVMNVMRAATVSAVKHTLCTVLFV